MFARYTLHTSLEQMMSKSKEQEEKLKRIVAHQQAERTLMVRRKEAENHEKLMLKRSH
mgnify:CR=1 FL=1